MASDTRAGYVALVGRPNVGKSTLLNALIGEKLSIVTARAQTTRERVLGIETTEREQIIFVDTPGLLEPRYLLQESMLEAAHGALEDADLVLLLLDATRPEDTAPSGAPLEWVTRRRDSLFVAINKIDVASPDAVETLADWSRSQFGLAAFRIAAAEGHGVPELRSALLAALPIGPFLYPADEIATQPVRFFVAEFVRETIFEQYEQEIPYSAIVAIDEFREAEDPIFIRATIYLEREPQKGIVIGRGGAAIKRLGRRSREKIEAFVGRRVYLDLWVKAMPRWRRKQSALKRFGFPVPPGGGSGARS